MSSLGALTITDSIQGPPAPANILGNEINRAKMGDAVGNLSSGQGMLILFSDIRDSLFSIAENTLRTNEILAGDTRDSDINEQDTDKNKDEDESKGPSALDKLKGVLGGLNPFSDGGPGPLTTALLALAGLFGLKTFGGPIKKGLTGVLETLGDGKLGDKIDEITDLSKTKIFDTFEKMKTSLTTMVAAMDRMITGLKDIFDSIEKMYKMLEDYTGGFDFDYTMDKLQPLLKKFSEEAVTAVIDFFGELVLAIGGYIIGKVFLQEALKLALANPALRAIFAGKPLAGAALTKAALTAGTIIPVAGLLLYGITTTWTNITNSIAKTIEQEGEFKLGTFLAKFFGGREEGGWFSALQQAFLVGGTFALGGMIIGIGLFAATGPGMLVGALVGGVIGTAVGAIIGAFTGWLGSNRLEDFGDAFRETIQEVIDYIKNFFLNIINNIKRFFGADTNPNLDLDKAEKDVKEAEEKLAGNPDYAPFINDLKKKKATLVDERANTEKRKLFNIKKIDSKIDKKQKEIDNLQKEIDKGNLMPGIDRFSMGTSFADQIIELENDKDILNSTRDDILSLSSMEGIIDPALSKAIAESKGTAVVNTNTAVVTDVNNDYSTTINGTGGVDSAKAEQYNPYTDLNVVMLQKLGAMV